MSAAASRLFSVRNVLLILCFALSYVAYQYVSQPQQKTVTTAELNTMSESTPSMTIEQLSGFNNLVITQPRCPFCVKAKDLLDDRGTEYKTLVLGTDLEKPEMIEFIEKAANTTVRTVPQIILDGKYIGGHDDLVAFLARQDDAADADMSDFEL